MQRLPIAVRSALISITEQRPDGTEKKTVINGSDISSEPVEDFVPAIEEFLTPGPRNRFERRREASLARRGKPLPRNSWSDR